jgi:hypothetical protein
VLKTLLVNLMSYSTAPVAWSRDNLVFGGASHIVGSQFGMRALHTRADAWHARTDARYSHLDRSDRTGSQKIDALKCQEKSLSLEKLKIDTH